MKPRILRNPDYSIRAASPAAPSQCKAIYPDGLRCMAHRRLRGGESDLCSTHAKLPVLEPDYAYEYELQPDPFDFDHEDWGLRNGMVVW